MTSHQFKPPQPPGPPPVAPLRSSRYTNFYLTLLILSTIGTTASLYGLMDLPKTLEYFDTAPGYTIVSLFSYFVILPAAIVALVLLWHKHHAGIWVKLATYVASVVTSIALFFVSGPVLEVTIRQITIEGGQTIASTLDETTLEAAMSGAFYASIALSVAGSILFATLWWFAWKKQVATDAENSA